MARERMRDRILNGDIVPTALRLGWPVMASNAFQTVYNLTDAFWLGKVGEEALAAPGASWPIMFLLMSLSVGFGVAGISLVSQYTGAGELEKANKAAGQLLSFFLVGSSVMAIVGFLFAGDLLRLIGTPVDVWPIATSYLKIVFLGIPFMFSHFGFRSLLGGYGDTRTPMILTISSAVFDTMLDPFFVFGLFGLPRMEADGAALTTVITRGIAALIGLYLLFSGKVGIKLKLSHLKPEFSWIRKIVSVGLPASIGQSGTALGFVALMFLVNMEGKIVLGAFTVGFRITNLVTVVLWGAATAISTMVGQNLGADQKERAERIVKRTILVFFLITLAESAVVYLLRSPIYRFFIDDQAVLDAGSKFITFFVPSVPFFAVFRLSTSAFEGSGHTKPSMVISLIRLWGLRILLSYILYFVFGMGAVGIWVGMALGNFGAAVLSVAWVSRGGWKEKIIGKEPLT